MTNKLLTIVIPTFNRAVSVSRLLAGIESEVTRLAHEVDVIIGNNASTDETQQVLVDFKQRHPSAIVIQHEQNLGAEENFCRCIDASRSRYFWIIGDDDLPKKGLVTRVVDFLRSKEPDLLYLSSEWKLDISGESEAHADVQSEPVFYSAEAFTRKVNVWVTFISGFVVRQELLHQLDPEFSIRRFSNTGLVQLGWVLPMLMHGRKLAYCSSRDVLATSNNSGGYKVLTVFATNLPKILIAACGPRSRIRSIVQRHLVWEYLPQLIWAFRFKSKGRFIADDALSALAPVRESTAYWLLLRPLLVLPRPLAIPFVIASKLIARAMTAIS